MAWKFRSIHAWCCRALGFLVLTAAAAQPYAVHISLAAPAPQIVWRYEYPGSPCVPGDYADVPVRPFLVNGTQPGTYRVLWFAANPNGYFASETAGTDVTPADITLEHFKRRPGCPRWLHSKPYAGSWPDSYYTGLWMVAPDRAQARRVRLVHQERLRPDARVLPSSDDPAISSQSAALAVSLGIATHNGVAVCYEPRPGERLGRPKLRTHRDGLAPPALFPARAAGSREPKELPAAAGKRLPRWRAGKQTAPD